MGYFKTFFLMFLVICLFVFAGYAMGGETGLFIALILGVLSNVFAYWYSDKVILSMYKAKLVSQNDSPELIKMVSELTTNAGLPIPAIYIIEEDSPNAFATGRNPSNAAIAVTRGLIEKLSKIPPKKNATKRVKKNAENTKHEQNLKGPHMPR